MAHDAFGTDEAVSPAMIYSCHVCRHLPSEHGPDGCVAGVTLALPGKISRQTCGCRAMVNGELAGQGGDIPGAGAKEAERERIDYASPSQPSPAAGSSTLKEVSQPMGLMDQLSEGAPISGFGSGTYAKAQDRASLWVNKTPFEVTAPPLMRAKRPEFVKPRDDGTMPDPNEWLVFIRLLDYRGDGTFGYVLQDDGEGGQATVDLTLTFSCNQRRNFIMQKLGEYVQEHRSAGPFRLDKEAAQGKGQPPWVLVDWQPTTPFAQSASSAAPVSATPTPATASPASVPDPYQYQEQAGVRYRWKEGMAAWEIVPSAPAPPSLPPPLPAGPPPLPTGVIEAQPIPATEIVKGFATTEGMPAAAVQIERADGSQMRQASYLGGGVVQQPSGVATQNSAGEEPRTRQEAGGMGTPPNPPGMPPQTPVAVEGGLGVEPVAAGAQAPSPAPTQAGTAAALRQAYDAGTPVGVTVHCDACLRPISTPAFFNKNTGVWLQAHQCPAVKKMRSLDATEAVRTAVGVG